MDTDYNEWERLVREEKQNFRGFRSFCGFRGIDPCCQKKI